MALYRDANGNLVDTNADGSINPNPGKVPGGPAGVAQPGDGTGLVDLGTPVVPPAQPAPATAPTWGKPPAPVAPMTGDLAMNKKLQGETYFDQHKDDFTQPGMAQDFTQGAIDKHAGQTPQPNRSAAMFGMWENLAPADMSSYYANAGRQATEQIKRQGAATGTYGTSASADLTAEALTNLAADRAKAEAQYGLQRTQLGGSLAGQADASGNAQSADERAWTLGLGGLAQGADAGRLAGLNAGTGAAMGAENSELNRINSLFGANLKGATSQSDVIGQANSGIFDRDKDLFGSGVAAGVAPYSEGAAQAIAGRSQADSDREVTMKNSAALAKLFQDAKK